MSENRILPHAFLEAPASARLFWSYTRITPLYGDFSDALATQTKRIKDDAETKRTRPKHLCGQMRGKTKDVAGTQGHFSRRIGQTIGCILSGSVSVGSRGSRSTLRISADYCFSTRPKITKVSFGRKINWTKKVKNTLDGNRPTAIILVAVGLPGHADTHDPGGPITLVAHGPAGVFSFGRTLKCKKKS